jgi:hypothetical protein
MKIRRVGNSNVVSLPRGLETRGFAAGQAVAMVPLQPGRLLLIAEEHLDDFLTEMGRQVITETRAAVETLTARDRSEATIAIISGPEGAQFDRGELHVPAGASIIWANKTETAQVILPADAGTRRTMRLAPAGEEGDIWMMRMRSSQQSGKQGGIYRWRLQSNEAARIAIVTNADAVKMER